MKIKEGIREFMHTLGPGIITAALVLGPGTLTVASKLGSLYQYQLLWVILFSTLFMIVFTTMSARYGFYNKLSLIETIRGKYGKFVSYFIGFSIFMVSISFQAGNAIGSGLAVASIFDTKPVPWIIFFSLAAMITLFFRSFYKILEKIMIILVLIMLVSFLITVIISSPDLIKVFQGFIPAFPKGSGLLSIAIVATSCSLAGAFYQSYLVQEKTWKNSDFSTCRRESITGIILLGLISMLVLTAAGSVLFTNGIAVNTAADMGKALEPLFGEASFIVFMIGLFAASFSSLLGNATLGGNILADTFRVGTTHEQWSTRALIMLLIVIGSLIAIVFNDFQLRLIVFAQAFTILVVPVIAFVMLNVTKDKVLMGANRNSVLINLLAIVGILALVGLTVSYVYLQYL